MYRALLPLATMIASLLPLASGAASAADAAPVPVILDTDIGSDIDDTWALLQLIRSPELDPKLVLCGTGNTRYRARIAARFLETAGRRDIAVGMGPTGEPSAEFQKGWLGDYTLEDYPGPVHDDGIAELIRLVRAAEEPLTLIAIGPLTNIVEALDRDPSIAPRLNFIGMFGAIDRGYHGDTQPVPEYNVYRDVPAFRRVLAADWNRFSLTPLDTCGRVRIAGDHYRALQRADDPAVRALMENYALWKDRVTWEDATAYFATRSSTLFDTVAVAMACDTPFLSYERMKISVTDKGLTYRDPVAGRPVRAAMEWNDLDGFYSDLVARLQGHK